MKIAVYARSATGPSVQILEVPAIRKQLSEIEDWAQQNEHEIVETFAEVGGGFSNRGSELDKMLSNAASNEHPYDAIVVRDYARISRQTLRLLEIIKFLETGHQVRIVSLENEANPFLAERLQRVMRAFKIYK